MQRLVKWAQTCKAWLSRREDYTDNWSVPKGKCKTNVKNVHIRERACLPSQILLSLLPSIPQQTTGRMGNACKRKKEEFFYKVIIHLLKKENLSVADTNGAGEAGSSDKESLKKGEGGLRDQRILQSEKNKNNLSHCFSSTVTSIAPSKFMSHPSSTCHLISFFKINSRFIFKYSYAK